MNKIILILVFIFSYTYGFNSFNKKCCKQDILNFRTNHKIINKYQINKLYKSNRYHLMWSKKDMYDLLDLLENPKINYLKNDYHQYLIRKLINKLNTNRSYKTKLKSRALLDLLLSDSFLLFAKNLNEGLIDWNKFQSLISQSGKNVVWIRGKASKNYLSVLKKALLRKNISKELKSYIPKDDGYKLLIDAYHRYKYFSKKGNFTKIDYGSTLKEGDYGNRVLQLKKYLYQSGDLKNVDISYFRDDFFDKKLKKAVMIFQKRNYLRVSGLFGKVEILYSRESIDDKLEKIKLNIERYKILSPIRSNEYIIINIPTFSLRYYKNNKILDDIRVIVGREDRPTPIFKDKLEYMVINPYWIIPKRLSKRDYVPQLVQNPYSLLKKDIHIHAKSLVSSKEIDPASIDWSKYLDENSYLPYTFIQYPGEHNVLGKMKFIFPNRYQVYLHDTNAKDLTLYRYRLFSSGCMRLSKPYDFLALMVKHTPYSYASVMDSIISKKTKTIKFSKKIPIHIRYFTAQASSSGDVEFRKDIYGLDKLQLRAMLK